MNDNDIDSAMTDAAPPDGLMERRHDAAMLRRAYRRGRRDEQTLRRRQSPRGAPVANGLLLLVACVSVMFLALAIHEGSFSRGGQVLDRSIGAATASALQTTRNAASTAGQAMQNAGDRLKQSAAGQG